MAHKLEGSRSVSDSDYHAPPFTFCIFPASALGHMRYCGKETLFRTGVQLQQKYIHLQPK